MRASDDDIDPGLPVKWNPCSNGEFVPPPPSPLIREAARRARAEAEVTARRLGMSRRRFLRSSLGTATALAALTACRNQQARYADCGEGPGGGFEVPPDAATEPEVVKRIFGGEEFVFDVQTHYLDADHTLPDLGISVIMPQRWCGEADPRDCFSVDRYLDLMFNRSQTDMLVLSALPFAGSPLNPDVMARAIDLADRVCQDRRLFVQGEAHPSLGTVEQLAENMLRLQDRLPVTAWKTYCHWGAPGWFLDDHDGTRPQVGQAFIDLVRRIGPKVIAVHKGLSGGAGVSRFASPVDVGPAAAANPDIRFVIYHSGFEAVAPPEGPYDPADDRGVNRLITSLRQAGIGPGGNVYAELGTTWRLVMQNPTAAAHVLGKLLVALGPTNVVWGTDSIWYGSPQDQINAFRAFCISPEFQERYGYPALTRSLKARILGLNAARLFGVEPVTTACRFDAIEAAQQAAPDANATLGPVTPAQVAAVARAEAAALHG